MCSLSFPDKDDTKQQSNQLNGYKITGNLREGNCSLELRKVSNYDEGNWRCVVRPNGIHQDIQGPLLHLHILDHNTASKHTHGKLNLIISVTANIYVEDNVVLCSWFIKILRNIVPY